MEADDNRHHSSVRALRPLSSSSNSSHIRPFHATRVARPCQFQIFPQTRNIALSSSWHPKKTHTYTPTSIKRFCGVTKTCLTAASQFNKWVTIIRWVTAILDWIRIAISDYLLRRLIWFVVSNVLCLSDNADVFGINIEQRKCIGNSYIVEWHACTLTYPRNEHRTQPHTIITH